MAPPTSLGSKPPLTAICHHPKAHLAADILVDQHILALVVEDDMNLLGAGATDVRALMKSRSGQNYSLSTITSPCPPH